MNSAMQQWNAVLLGLPDAAFFEIIRNYLGPVKTPYNKHRLIEKLNIMLKKNRQTIISYIDKEDRTLLSVIRFLDQPTINSINGFFGTEKQYIEIYLHLLNLEERLLVYLTKDGTYAFNPLLADDLERVTSLHSCIQYSAIQTIEGNSSLIWLQPQLIFYLLAYFNSNPVQLKTDFSLRKNTVDFLEDQLPSLKGSKTDTSRLELILQIMLKTGLIHRTEDGTVTTSDRLFQNYDFTSSNFALWLQGAFIYEAIHTNSVWNSQIMHVQLEFIAYCLERLHTDYALSSAHFCRIVSLFKNGILAQSAEKIKETMITLGLLLFSDEDLLILNPQLEQWLSFYTGDAQVVFSQGNEIIVSPQTKPADFCSIAFVSEPVHADTYSHFELTRTSVIAAFNRNKSADSIIKSLNNFTGHELPQNVKTTIYHWEEQYNQVQILEGTVLMLKDHAAELLEQSNVLDPWLIKKLDKGIYLLMSECNQEWTAALKAAGIDIIPEKIKARSEESVPLQKVKMEMPVIVKEKPVKVDFIEPDFDELSEALTEKKMTPEEKAELNARIQKKLILATDQLKPNIVRLEKKEAKGLDYLGKVRIIEQVLKDHNTLLEVHEPDIDGETQKILIRPLELEKTGKDVLLHATTLPEYTNYKIAVRKISLIRKLKGSLYAP